MIRPDTDDLIAFLNSLLEVDRYAVAELILARVPCNAGLADHPTVQVASAGSTTFIEPGTYRVGMLGILNGYCGADAAGNGPIAAVYEGGRLARFERFEVSRC